MTKATLVALPLLLGSLLIAVPAAATADPATPNFGQHVSTCAQTMGFSADHNPGMHQGAAAGTACPAKSSDGRDHGLCAGTTLARSWPGHCG